MKDPLQTIDTAYDVLGVGRDADKAAIDRAYMETLSGRRTLRGNRVPANRASAARLTLLNPAKRAQIHLLEYDPQVLGRLNPCPLDANSILLPHDRATTAAAWEQQLSAAFPDPQVTHALAVFWYWWTLHEEQRIAALLQAAGQGPLVVNGDYKHALLRRACQAAHSDCEPGRNGRCRHTDCPWGDDCRWSPPPLETMWQRVIGYWGTLTANADFWSTFHGVPGANGAEVRTLFLGDLKNMLAEVGQRYPRALPGSPESADGLGSLPGVGSATARTLRDLGIQSPAEILVFGSRRLATKLGQRDAEVVMDAVRSVFSGHVQPPELYRTLEFALATELKASEAMIEVGVKRDRGKVCCGALMLQQLGMLQDVCRAVEAALQRNPGNAQLQFLRNALSPYSAVTMLLDNHRAADALVAIETLPAKQRGSSEAARPRAKAFFLLGRQRAEVGRIEEALENWESALEYAVDDLAKDIRNEVATTCHTQALALRRHDPDHAIAILRTGLRLAGQEHVEIPVQLSDCLAGRGIRRVNEALETRSLKMKELEETMNGLAGGPAGLEGLIGRDELRKLGLGNLAGLGKCAMCPSYVTPYSINLPQGGTASLCTECKGKLERRIREAQEFGDEAIGLLYQGFDDLTEAVALDPTNTHAQTNLVTATNFVNDLPPGRRRGAQAAPARPAPPPPRPAAAPAPAHGDRRPVERHAPQPPRPAPASKPTPRRKTPSTPPAVSTPRRAADQRHILHALVMLLVPPMMVVSLWANTFLASGSDKLWNWGWCGTITIFFSFLFGYAAILHVCKKGPRWYWQRVCKTRTGKKGEQEAAGIEGSWYVIGFILVLTLTLGRGKPQAAPSPARTGSPAEAKTNDSQIVHRSGQLDPTVAPEQKQTRQPTAMATDSTPTDEIPAPPVRRNVQPGPATKPLSDRESTSVPKVEPAKIQTPEEQAARLLAKQREELQAKPKDVTLLNNTAWTLATSPFTSVRNGSEAVKLAQQATELSQGREPAILGTLAAAYAESGQFAEAVATAHKAFALASEQHKSVLAISLLNKLSLYEKQTPYREMSVQFKPTYSVPAPPVRRNMQPGPATKLAPDSGTIPLPETKPAKMPIPPPDYRIWTDATGKYRSEGAFAGVASGKATLKKRDGSTTHVPLEKLSKDDRQWIEDQKKGRVSEEQPHR